MTAAPKRAVFHPPFEHDTQLFQDQDLRVMKPSAIFAECERLLKSLCDADLDRMHTSLWYAGRRGNISPLHHQRVLRREVILTERARLHLVWFEKTVYVQRLADELLNWRYFAEVVCSNVQTYQAATGFLLSYAYLVQDPSDLQIAKSTGLISTNVTWRAWQDFRSNILHHVSHRTVHDRFEYGELRLGRLNQIYRLRLFGLTYFNVHRDYSSYFGDNYMTLVALFALVSVALSAMQVMAGRQDVSAVVRTTTYRFAAATLVALAASCSILLSLYFGLYLWNWLCIFLRRSIQRRQDDSS